MFKLWTPSSIHDHKTFSLIIHNFGIGQEFASRFSDSIAYNTITRGVHRGGPQKRKMIAYQ